MPWTLEIHVFDVGVGESALVVAQNKEVGAFRSILIDGGLPAAARTVHENVRRLTGDRGPDVVLVTHVDTDHSGGVAGLFFADNLTAVCLEIARVAAPYADRQQIAATNNGDEGDSTLVARRVACAVYGAIHGSWGDAEFDIYNTAVKLKSGGVSIAAAAEDGLKAAIEKLGKRKFGNPTLFTTPIKSKNAARAAAAAAAEAYVDRADAEEAIAEAVFQQFRNQVPGGAEFWTYGMYNDTTVVDIGDVASAKDVYYAAVKGRLQNGSPAGLAMPGVRRQRTALKPPLGTELFWGGAAPPAANAPYAVVVSGPYGKTEGAVWQGAGNPLPYSGGGDVSNCMSIGLMIRFNDFLYFTGGDMPSQGEDPLSAALLNWPLPDGAGGTLPAPAPPPPVIAFKAGHHGASTSTSDHMLQSLLPKAAYISCGSSHDHPTQDVIDRLYGSSVRLLFLTNCRVHRDDVPASPDVDFGEPPLTDGSVDQWEAGNRAYIAGDNPVDNFEEDRTRGDIRIVVGEAGSTEPVEERFYRTVFSDFYPPLGYEPGAFAVHEVRW